MIGERFAQYVRHKSRGEDDDTDDSQDAATTMECFLALFADHEEFVDEEAADAFLSTATSYNDPKILGKLREWTDNILRRFRGYDNRLSLGASTSEEIAEQIKPFTRNISDATLMVRR